MPKYNTCVYGKFIFRKPSFSKYCKNGWFIHKMFAAQTHFSQNYKLRINIQITAECRKHNWSTVNLCFWNEVNILHNFSRPHTNKCREKKPSMLYSKGQVCVSLWYNDNLKERLELASRAARSGKQQWMSVWNLSCFLQGYLVSSRLFDFLPPSRTMLVVWLAIH